MPDNFRFSVRDPEPFLPNLCAIQAVFMLVLLGELLAVALTVADSGLEHFNWGGLGLRSFLILWIFLLSAASLCPLRLWLGGLPSALAGAVSYLLVLAVTLLCTVTGLWILDGWQSRDGMRALESLLLAAIFAGVLLRYLYLQQQLHNQQQAELRARIQALQSRIQPHFLFNSMNSIASLISVEPEKAEKLVEDLCELFRASLAEPGQVPLNEELLLCRHYMSIEQVRLGSRLQVKWHLSPGLEKGDNDVRIPRLLLQPLLENAIQHGIAPIPEGGTVQVRAEVRDGRLELEVTNPLPAQPAQPGNQMALTNIHNRLQALFGNRATFKTQVQNGEFSAYLAYPVDGYLAEESAG
ncbi:histidine kinase [Pseudomaricurvus alkylphenolicus]|jgi:two-component system sensor histidine kinase AlgZ|uniref:sensor histidine kinase n=1 Tax=Pseudomaricurvus alkylphenolicus TaxID=1306991 RepID=UPI00142050B3|nr:histidine kinase [Pseudomaricurvus alkylphenolicus]NIB39406.1 histidine kinase [Pseudomaricurvus alkylphenolicus]